MDDQAVKFSNVPESMVGGRYFQLPRQLDWSSHGNTIGIVFILTFRDDIDAFVMAESDFRNEGGFSRSLPESGWQMLELDKALSTTAGVALTVWSVRLTTRPFSGSVAARVALATPGPTPHPADAVEVHTTP